MTEVIDKTLAELSYIYSLIISAVRKFPSSNCPIYSNVVIITSGCFKRIQEVQRGKLNPFRS